jgi:hypothetical protein
MMEELVDLPIPKLSDIERLYVKTYLHTLSHPRAHEAVSPGINKGKEDNPYSRRHAVQFNIRKELQKRAESLTLDPEKIIEMLYNEATSLGAGTNQAARVTALTLLGKHLGMFKEKSDKENIQINILTYGAPEIVPIEADTSGSELLEFEEKIDPYSEAIELDFNFEREIKNAN